LGPSLVYNKNTTQVQMEEESASITTPQNIPSNTIVVLLQFFV